jgi:AcrR family transcriptional regulator
MSDIAQEADRMKIGRPPLSRERIVDAAFRAWGRTWFTHTSLNLVADEMGVTKPAVYRYFRSKDEILHAMEQDYGQRMHAHVISVMKADEALGGA